MSGRAAARAPAPFSTPQHRGEKRRQPDADKENAWSDVRPHKSPRHSLPEDTTSVPTPSAARTSVGPTPQRNGTILGLFDLLSPASPGTPRGRGAPSTDSPAGRRAGARGAGGHGMTAHDTAARGAAVRGATGLTTPAKSHARSSSLAALASPARTPQRSSAAQMDTPGSAETPAFLRRGAGALFARAAPSSGAATSPVPVHRVPPRPQGKSLSQLLRGLRDADDERLNDELDALRELEAGEAGGEALGRPMGAEASGTASLNALGESGWVAEQERPLGADGAALAISGVHDGAPDAAQRRYKKKGQKRTTRHVAIGVSTRKVEAEPEWDPGQQDATSGKDPGATGRKVAPTAHANFRALKIKNKNSKAKRGGRFGRR